MPLTNDVVSNFAEWQQVLIVLGASIVIATLLRSLIRFWLRQSERLTSTELDRIILGEVNYPIYISLILGGAHVSLPLLVPEEFLFITSGVILTAILAVWARAGLRIVPRMVQTLQKTGYEIEFAPVLQNLWSFFFLLGAFFLFLSIWELDITPLLASAGVLGIVLGIAAQDSIGNLIGGIALHLDKTFELGDVVQLDSETRGTVTELSIRSTTILTRDNVAITIPNAELNRSRITNESAPVRRRRIRLNVGVAYDSDLEIVEQKLLEVAAEEPMILDTPKSKVRFRSFDDSSIRAQVQCYIDHPANVGKARHVLIKRITEQFREEGIVIPFPQRELSILADQTDVDLVPEEIRKSD